MATIDDFFIREYEKMRDRVAELEAEAARLAPNGYGCFDLHEPRKAVSVKLAPESWYNKTYVALEDLEEASGMDDARFAEWAVRPHTASPASYYILRPIEVAEKTFTYSLRFIETRRDEVLCTDGDCELVSIAECEDPGDCFGKWVGAEHRAALVGAALPIVRGRVEAEIERRKGKDG